MKSGGALFPAKKNSQSSPDFTGNLELDEELINYINTMYKKNPDEIKLELAAWRRESRNGGKKYLSLKPNIPFEKRASNKRRTEETEFNDEIPF